MDGVAPESGQDVPLREKLYWRGTACTMCLFVFAFVGIAVSLKIKFVWSWLTFARSGGRGRVNCKVLATEIDVGRTALQLFFRR